MSIDEAIKILEYPVFKWSLEWDDREDGLDYCDAIQLAIEALEEKKEREVNEPLSLESFEERLNNLNGWTWCRNIPDDSESGWYKNETLSKYANLNKYGETWIAYKYPPVESKGCE